MKKAQKKIFFIFIILVMSMTSKVYSKTVEVLSLDSFTTAEAPSSITVKLLEPLELNTDMLLSEGTLVKGELTDVISPKRLKRDAKFTFVPTSYKDDTGSHIIDGYIQAHYTQPLDKKGLAKSAALSVGNFFLKGLKIGVTAIEGAVRNDSGNRLKSSAKSVYEASPVAYVEKGHDIVINKDQIFYLKFPNIKDEKDAFYE